MTRTLRDTQPGVQYTAPPVFYELERCFQRGIDSLDELDPRPNKRAKVVRKPAPPFSDAQDDDEVDQLASSDDDDDEEWWLAQADLVKLDSGLLAHKRAQGKGGTRAKKDGKATGPSAGKKGGSSGAKSRKGRDRLTKLPREVLYTIFAQCPLASLLSLSRTAGALRTYLASDDADDLWADARDEIGLPELDEDEGWVWPEVGLAQLVYGKTCSSCGKHSARWPDCFLRLRLCKSCELKQIVRLDQLAKTHRELHPASKDCVIQSHQPPANPQNCVKTPYGLLSELDKHDDVLRVLQEQDDQADEVYYARAFERQHKHHGGGTKSRPIELDSEDDIEQSGYEVKPRRNAGEWGSRVRRYVGDMREKAEPIEQEGELLFPALTKLYAAEDAEANRPDERSTARRLAIEKRVLALDGPEDWCEADFTGSWLTAESVNEGDECIDDAEWATLHPRVLAVLKRARNKRLQASQRDAQLKRRELLRPYYYDMRQAQGTAMARIYTPLFADILLFPSVRALWFPQDGVVDAATWAAAREGVAEDLNEWRCDLRLHALRLILQNTLDIPDDEELDPDADAYNTATYDDAFFDQLASSALLCAIDGCYQPARVKEGERHAARPTYFGTLTELLAHQHEAHDYLLPTAKELAAPASSPPTFRIALPLEVSNAVVALCDAIGLDWEDASLDDLDEAYGAALERKGAWVQWWNAPGKGKARGKREKKDWRTIICHIKREVDKAAKARPPRVLDIPVIVFEPGKGGNTVDA